MRPDTPVTIWEESRVPCLNSRWGLTPLLSSIGTLRSLWQLEKNTELLAPTRDEDLLPCSNLRGILQCHSQLGRRSDFPEATMRGSLRSPLQLEKNPKLPATTWETPRDSRLNVIWSLIPCSDSRAIQDFPHNQKKTWLPWVNTRGYLRFPVATREEP